MTLQGPVVILNKTSTIVVEPFCEAKVDDYGNVEITLKNVAGEADFKKYQAIEEVPLDPIELSIFGHRFMSIAEQMGITL